MFVTHLARSGVAVRWHTLSPWTGEVRWKCHLINAASAQMPSHKCSVSTKRRNSENNECLYNNIWGCTKYQRFPSRKRTKEKTNVYYCKIQENIKINALMASLSRLTASTEVENKVSTDAENITRENTCSEWATSTACDSGQNNGA